MKNMYTSVVSRWLFMLLLLSSQPLLAQTAPVIQWQRVLPSITEVKAVQTPNGDIITTNGSSVLKLSGISGTEQWKTALPTTYQYSIGIDLAPLPDGGVTVLARDPYKWLLIRLTASGAVRWLKPFRNITQSGELTQTKLTRVVQASDGGYVAMGSTQYGRDGSSTDLYRFDAEGNLVSTKGLGYIYPNAPRPVSVGNSLIKTSNGSYLVVGTTKGGSESTFLGWAAKLTSELNLVWQNKYEKTINFNDAIESFDGQSYLVTGTTTATLPSYAGILAIDTNGQLVQRQRSDTQTGDTYFFSGNASIDMFPGSSPFKSVLFTTSNASSNRGNDFRLSTPGLTISLGGSGSETASSFVTTPDGGFLLSGTTTSTDGDVKEKTDNTPSGWLVKLAPVKILVLGQPTYDCSTGTITFNTTGGDGSPIVFSAPGITRSSVTSNTGIVEHELRNDPKPIFINATQSGQSTSSLFDLRSYCTVPLTPILRETIPDQSRPVNVQIVNNIIPINSYFNGVPAFQSFRPIVNYRAAGLPPGLILFDSSNESQQLAYIGGTPTATGTYPVTITAYVSNASAPQPSVSTTFRITITDNQVVTPPPTGGSLTLTQPTYDCATGTITFNTTGGDGSPITYTAPGITRSSVTSNSGTVEQGLRNDPKTITITAMQNGQTTIYGFDLKAACSGTTPTTPTPTPNPIGGTLTLKQPTYNCATGAFTFNYAGGDGSPVEFQAIGITGWTTNSNQFVDRESRTASDVKPFTLMARQNGQLVTYTWDLKAACGRSARMAATEAGQALELTVKGNPVGNTAVVEIRGAEGRALQLDLLNASGHVLEQRHIEQAGAVDEQRFDLQRQPAGLLFLRAQSEQQQQTVKLIKQ